MIAIDTNILVYAHRKDSPFHERALSAVRALAEGSAAWALPWPCVHEFLAIVSHPKIFPDPTPMERALAQVTAWLESPTATPLAETTGYDKVLVEVVRAARIVGPQVHDARIAALCRHHGVRELWSADRDFSRFPGLTIRNPLVGEG